MNKISGLHRLVATTGVILLKWWQLLPHKRKKEKALRTDFSRPLKDLRLNRLKTAACSVTYSHNLSPFYDKWGFSEL